MKIVELFLDSITKSDNCFSQHLSTKLNNSHRSTAIVATRWQ